MIAFKCVLAGLLICVMGGMLWLGNGISRLRGEQQRLLAERQEMELQAAKPATADTAQAAPSATVELLRLRNEVGRLRAVQPRLDQLRAENERLTAELRSGQLAKQDITQMEGYLAKETWANVGFATPEAALQTFLWAVREGNIAHAAECMEPRQKAAMLKVLQLNLPEESTRLLEGWRVLTQSAGLRIAERVAQDDNRVTFSLQAVAGGSKLPIQVRRYGDEWKLGSL